MFLKLAKQHTDTVTERIMVQNPIRILTAPYLAMRYVNDGRYFPRIEAPDSEKMQKGRKQNVRVYHTEFSSSATYFGSCMLPPVSALRNLRFGVKLFVNYINN